MTTTTSRSNSNLVRARFLADLVLIQQDTAPISLSIGATVGGIVRPDFIVIKDAPQTVIRAVNELADRYGLTFSLGPLGLLISFETAREMSREEFFK